MDSHRLDGPGAVPAALNTIRNHLIVALPDNFDGRDIDDLETRVLTCLSRDTRIRGVIVDCTSVHCTDATDLARLQDCLLAVRLLGRRVALCGINPGLAAVIIRCGQELYRDLVGHDIDAVLRGL